MPSSRKLRVFVNPAGLQAGAATWAEAVAPSDADDEYIQRDDRGRLIHRVDPRRAYLAMGLGPVRKALPDALRLRLRLLERVLELVWLYDRSWDAIESDDPLLQRVLSLLAWRRTSGTTNRSGHVAPVRSADLICCTFGRWDELRQSVPSMLREVDRARRAGISCDLHLVFQNDGFDEWFREHFPEAKPHVTLHASMPPGLTRARNVGASKSSADLVIFVDDDVVLDDAFVERHVEAANRHPEAIAVAGRIRSRIEGPREPRVRAVGQLRPTGHVEAWFDSIYRDEVIVPMTPRGANMAYRRTAMNALFGRDWFDETLTGSAHREETTLALRLFRLDEHFVYAPDASLLHFEAESGGCENRVAESEESRRRRLELEYRFLRRLFARIAGGPTLLTTPFLLRDILSADTVADFFVRARTHAAARHVLTSTTEDEAEPQTAASIMH